MIFVKPVEKFDETNFMYNTACIWRPILQPRRKPDYESDSGSKYWYTEAGVIRSSDHWGASIASCKWWLVGKADFQYVTRTFARRATGFANWSDFVDRSAWDSERNEFVCCQWFDQGSWSESPAYRGINARLDLARYIESMSRRTR